MSDPLGMLVAMAVGDAFGAGFEYALPGFVARHNDLRRYHQHPTHTELLPGQYTDGVQMAAALADLLLDEESELNHRTWADRLLGFFQANPRVGYARGFHAFLESVENADEFLARIKPHSNKSGAAERAVVCGFLDDEQLAINRAMWQASLTHATQDGMTAAAASALLVWGCRHGVLLKDLPDYLAAHLPGVPWTTLWKGPVDGQGLSAVRAALRALQSGFKLTTMLKHAVALTGDVDGVAGITMAAATLHPNVEHNLPKALVNGLENGPRGRDWLATLDAELEQRFPLSYGDGAVPSDDGEGDDSVFDLFESGDLRTNGGYFIEGDDDEPT